LEEIVSTVGYSRERFCKVIGQSNCCEALKNVDLLDWQACDQAIETGYRHAVEKLEQLGKSLASCTRGITTGMAL
jgi:hypothetical protein